MTTAYAADPTAINFMQTLTSATGDQLLQPGKDCKPGMIAGRDCSQEPTTLGDLALVALETVTDEDPKSRAKDASSGAPPIGTPLVVLPLGRTGHQPGSASTGKRRLFRRDAPPELLQRAVQLTVEFHDFLDLASTPFLAIRFSWHSYGDLLFVN